MGVYRVFRRCVCDRGNGSVLLFCLILWFSSSWFFSHDTSTREYSRRERTIKPQLREKLMHISERIYEDPPVANPSNPSLKNAIDIFRDIPDARKPECEALIYEHSTIPKRISVVIVVYNEPWYMLLLTVNSVLFRTAAYHLKEILIVDDFSMPGYINDHLLEYINALPRTRIIRNAHHHGFVRSRMIGAHAAVGDVLVFLDCGVEVGTEWIEPLLAVIKDNSRVIALPHLDDIHPETGQYVMNDKLHMGGFTWDLRTTWQEKPGDFSTKENRTDPYATPVLHGAAFAVERMFFEHIGGFDENLGGIGSDRTAAELELSFRSWLCSHGVSIAPCSRVAYITPASPWRSTFAARHRQLIADVWMDKYAGYFRASSTSSEDPYSEEEAMTINDRKVMYQRMRCRPFEWYLSSAGPDFFLALGERNIPRQYKEYGHKQIVAEECTTSVEHQWQLFTHLPENILRKTGEDNKVVHLMSSRTHDYPQCLTEVTMDGSQVAAMWPCDQYSPYAYWQFTYHMDFSALPASLYPSRAPGLQHQTTTVFVVFFVLYFTHVLH